MISKESKAPASREPRGKTNLRRLVEDTTGLTTDKAITDRLGTNVLRNAERSIKNSHQFPRTDQFEALLNLGLDVQELTLAIVKDLGYKAPANYDEYQRRAARLLGQLPTEDRDGFLAILQVILQYDQRSRGRVARHS